MAVADFQRGLSTHFDEFKRTLATDAGEWVVKGFIDVYRNVYTISVELLEASPSCCKRSGVLQAIDREVETRRISDRSEIFEPCSMGMAHLRLMAGRCLTITG